MPLQRFRHERRGTRLPRALDGRTAVVRLFDAYAGLLTERQQTILRLYYHDDFSLGEIATRAGVTRQAVFDSLRRSVSVLWRFEQRVGVLAERDRHARARQILNERLNDVEHAVAQLADADNGNLAPLRGALRALRESV
jgi:uncharacterized protein